jgi:spermidine/putrescine transport system substrate-binding protein
VAARPTSRPSSCAEPRGVSRRGALAALVAAPLAVWSCGTRSRLSLYNWGDYVARTVLDGFVVREREAGRSLEITEDVYLSEAEMVAKLRTRAAYDVAFPIDYLLDQLVREGSIRPIDTRQLPNARNLAPAFGPWVDKADIVHAIPYLWGTTGIGYDSEKVDPPTSWNALFDPRYEGRISVIDSKGDVMDQALLAAGLGINSIDKERIRTQIRDMLFEQKALLRAYDSNPARALVAGETWIAQIDSGDLMRAQAERPSLRYVIPDEGAALWTDHMAIASASLAPELALRFIDYLLEPEVAADNANTLFFATPNQAALDRGLVLHASDPQVYPAPEVIARLQRSDNWVGTTGEIVDEIWVELRND